jgi:hypothetical protein
VLVSALGSMNVGLYSPNGTALPVSTGSTDDFAFGSANATAVGVLAGDYLFDGTLTSGFANWDRSRSASATNLALANKVGIQMSEGSGHWSQGNEPATNNQATTSKAAGGAGVRHVCTAFSGSIMSIAAIVVPVYLRVRDGASGAGTVLWTMGFVVPAGTTLNFGLSGLSLLGTANTAMTCEFSAAPGATNFESVSMSGYSAA